MRVLKEWFVFGVLFFTFPAFAVDQATLNDVLTQADIEKAETAYARALKSLAMKRLLAKKNQDVEAAWHEMDVEEALKEKYPLTPQDILKERKKREALKSASKQRLKPIRKNLKVIEQGFREANIPTIHVSSSFLSVIEVFDTAGNPWPIEKVDMIVNEFTAPKISGEKNNQIQVSCHQSHAEANIVILLKGTSESLNLFLKSSDEIADIKTTLMVKGLGPVAKSTHSHHAFDEKDAMILNFAAGLPPKEAKRVQVTGMEAEGWLFEGYFYVRTQNVMNAPRYLASRQIADFKVYKFKPISTATFSTKHGDRLQVSFSRKAVG